MANIQYVRTISVTDKFLIIGGGCIENLHQRMRKTSPFYMHVILTVIFMKTVRTKI